MARINNSLLNVLMVTNQKLLTRERNYFKMSVMPKKDLLKAVIEYTKVSLNHKPYDLTIYIVLIKVNLILKV